jgi:serine/threonine-protein kinase
VQNNAQDDDVVMNLVEMTLAEPAEEREQCLLTACGEDPLLLQEVWKYVTAEQRMNGFLLDPFYSPPSTKHPFERGEVLDGRFRIVREVAEGGMGVVYEALDEKLDRRIAIKSAKSWFEKRLPPEVRHASEIAHPNVCRIFEIHTTTTDRGDIDFLTMEFLDGETLAERLRRGALPEKEARVIAQQLCAGLAAAHRTHVIHGDLKSNNVILTTTVDGGVRAVITDFGLARRTETTQQTIQSGTLGGTPNYMAPELWRGEKASVASDIYALGVILYEMIGGRLPYTPASLPAKTESLSNRSTPETLGHPNAEFNEDRRTRRPPPVHPRWDRILFRCLDADPLRRFRNVDELAVAFAPRSRLWVMAAAGIMLAVIAAGMTYERASQLRETVRLAVLPFETDGEHRALADRLLNEAKDHLAQVKGSRAFVIVGPTMGSRTKIDTPNKAATELKATHVLTGTLQWKDGRALIQTVLSDATSFPLKQWSAEFDPNEIRYIPLALAGVVTGALHLPPVHFEAALKPSAAGDFSRGVTLARRDDKLDTALPLLDRAVAADPDSPLTHARLAETLLLKYHATGDAHLLHRARLSLASAEKRNTDLALIWLVSGILDEYTRSYAAAEADLQRARELEPGSADVWRHLGGVYESSNRLSEAEVAFQKAIELEPGYFKNYQDLCSFYGNHGGYDQAVSQCRHAIALAQDMAAAHYTLTRVYLLWGRYPEAEQESSITLELDPMSPGALSAHAIALFDQRQYQKAIPFFKERAKIDPELDLSYVNLGTGYRLANQPENARRAYQKGADLARAHLSGNPRDGAVRSHLAYLYARLGDPRQAEYEAGQALQLAGGSVDAIFFVVMTYEALNKHDPALDLLSRAPPELLRRLKHDAQPDLAGLHTDSRFQQLIEVHNVQ